jgi:hypothetical protein
MTQCPHSRCNKPASVSFLSKDTPEDMLRVQEAPTTALYKLCLDETRKLSFIDLTTDRKWNDFVKYKYFMGNVEADLLTK